MLSTLPQDRFRNYYDYNQFAAGHYWIQAIVGAASTITLPIGELKDGLDRLPDEVLTLTFMDMEGHTFITSLPLIRRVAPLRLPATAFQKKASCR